MTIIGEDFTEVSPSEPRSIETRLVAQSGKSVIGNATGVTEYPHCVAIRQKVRQASSQIFDCKRAKGILVRKSERDKIERSKSSKAVQVVPLATKTSAGGPSTKRESTVSEMWKSLISLVPVVCNTVKSELITKSAKSKIPISNNKPVAIKQIKPMQNMSDDFSRSKTTRNVLQEGFTTLIPTRCRRSKSVLVPASVKAATKTLSIEPSVNITESNGKKDSHAEAEVVITPDNLNQDEKESRTDISDVVEVHSSPQEIQPYSPNQQQPAVDTAEYNPSKDTNSANDQPPSAHPSILPQSVEIINNSTAAEGGQVNEHEGSTPINTDPNQRTFTTFLKRLLPKWGRAEDPAKFRSSVRIEPKPTPRSEAKTGFKNVIIAPPKKFRSSLKVRLSSNKRNTFIVPVKKAGSDIIENTTLPVVEPGPVTPPAGDSTEAIFPLKHFHRESIHGPSADTKAAGITKSIQNLSAEQSKLHVNQSVSVNEFPKPSKVKLLPITLLPKPLSQTQAVESQTNPKAAPVRKVLEVRKTQSQQHPKRASDIGSHFPLRYVHKESIHGKQPSVSDVKSKSMRRSSVNTKHQPAKPKPTDLIGNGAVFPLRHVHRQSINGTQPPTLGDDMGVVPIPPPLPASVKQNIGHEPVKQDGTDEQAIGAIFPLRHVHRPSIHGKPQTSVNSPDSVPEPPPLPPGMITNKLQSPKQTPVDTDNTAAIFPLKHVHRPRIHGELP